MKICLVTMQYSGKTAIVGCVGTYVADLAREYQKSGHEVHVLVAEALRKADVVENGIHFHERTVSIPRFLYWEFLYDRLPLVELWESFLVGIQLKQIVRKYAIDIVETSSYKFLSLFLLLAQKRKPRVLTRVTTTLEMTLRLRLSKFSKKQRMLFGLEKIVIKRSDFLIVPTEAHRCAVSKTYGIPVSEIQVVTLGIDLDFWGQGKASPETTPLFALYVGRLELRKGIDVLLQAIPLVLARHDSVRFIIAGDDHKNRYRDQFFETLDERYRSRVDFLGRVSDKTLFDLYRDCSIFVMPSRYESFGLPFLEAMSFGKPVIGCPEGGVPEVVKEDEMGFLANTEDPEDLAGKILILLRDERLRRQFGENALAHVQKSFSSHQMAKASLKVYRNMLGLPELEAAVMAEVSDKGELTHV